VITYFLGIEETRAYLRDLLRRIERFEMRPTVWCPITRSGIDLLKVMLDLIRAEFPQLAEGVRVLPIEVDGKIKFLAGNPSSSLWGQSVLLLDGAIHSGAMMSRCATKVLSYGPSALSSYALVIKRGSGFIPTLWGVTMDETDRAFFLLDEIPNNRLDAGYSVRSEKRQPPVHIERLAERMLDLPKVVSGVKSMDRMTWSDRHFQMKSTRHQVGTYVLERCKSIVGYLTMHTLENGTGLMIDEIAVDKKQRGRDYGGILMRFADTLARQANSPVIRLFAIADKVGFYKGFGYRLVDGESPITLGNEIYNLMEKVVTYYLSPSR
jgi:N-acetylglutamate synthase-like GNAT family acetyltransferase